MHGIMRATDVMLAGKTVIISGYCDVGKGCAQAMRTAGARTLVPGIDPICALQAVMEGLRVSTLEDVIGEGDVVISTTGNQYIVRLEHIELMKNNAIVENTGHFGIEIDIAGLAARDWVCKFQIKEQVDRWIFPDGDGVIVLAEGRLFNLGCATGHPCFFMNCSFSNQTLAQVELWESRKSGRFGNGVHNMPKVLDEKVATLHLQNIGAKLTILSPGQADYIGIKLEGPYKPESYRY